MIHSILGVAHLDSGRPDDALGHLEKSLEYRRKANDERGITAALTNLAKLYLNEGDLDRARASLEEGLALSRAYGEFHNGVLRAHQSEHRFRTFR